MILPHDLETSAHRSGEEYGWQRIDALRAVDAVTTAGLAVLGGEVWLVVGDSIWGVVPQRCGAPAIQHWSCERRGDEAWAAYASRSATEGRQAISSIPDLSSAVLPERALVYYNLTWASESEWSTLSR